MCDQMTGNYFYDGYKFGCDIPPLSLLIGFGVFAVIFVGVLCFCCYKSRSWAAEKAAAEAEEEKREKPWMDPSLSYQE